MFSCDVNGQSNATKNVLFLVSDDLRPDLGCYENPNVAQPIMHTPNLDKLASRSLLLKRAYVQQAVCNPSRNFIANCKET